MGQGSNQLSTWILAHAMDTVLLKEFGSFLYPSDHKKWSTTSLVSCGSGEMVSFLSHGSSLAWNLWLELEMETDEAAPSKIKTRKIRAMAYLSQEHGNLKHNNHLVTL